jgi:hypothetical protein
MKPIQKWLKNELRSLEPIRVIATTEARCNLACEHCYWAHDLHEPSVEDWLPAARHIAMLGTPVFFAGRILTPNGASFLRNLLENGVKEIGIVDNGYTILNYPEFLPHYTSVNISIDGWCEDHDRQRGKVGAFDTAWQTVLNLKSRGLDPVISSALSPITLPNWEKFEDLLAEMDVPMSSTLVWNLPETAKRGKTTIVESEMCKSFEKLISGIPKLINIYAPQHVRTLWPILSSFTWELDVDEGDCLTTTLPSGTVLVYRPPSLVSVCEQSLQWDGIFYTPFMFGLCRPVQQVDQTYLDWVRRNNATEVEMWKPLLKGGEDTCQL